MASMDAPAMPEAQPEANVTEETRQRNEDGTFARQLTAPERDSDPALEAEEAPDTAADDAGDSDDSDEQTEEEQPQKRNRRSAQERISQLTAQRNEAIAKAKAAEDRFKELQERLSKPLDPDLEFTDPATFNQEILNRTLDARDAEQAQRDYRAAYEAKILAHANALLTKADSLADELPDFRQVVDETLPITDFAISFLGEHEHGPQVAYYLGKNRAEAARIYNLSEGQQGAALERLASRVGAKPAKRVTKAPPPARAITGGGSQASMSPHDASVADIARMLGYGNKR